MARFLGDNRELIVTYTVILVTCLGILRAYYMSLCLHFVCLFVCLQDYAILNRFSRGPPRKTLVDFGNNLDHVRSGLGLRLGGWGRDS